LPLIFIFGSRESKLPWLEPRAPRGTLWAGAALSLNTHLCVQGQGYQTSFLGLRVQMITRYLIYAISYLTDLP
ncbi:hypothetical protein PS017_24835, partial [Shigella sonnei]|nr:hypothetical protein [Shigella sonnei]